MNIHKESNDKNPKISVIVPVYDTEKYFSRCFNSILNQTYTNLEIIVVNDRSPGNIAELIKPYMEKDQRIKYIEHEVNQGVFLTRLTGFEHSSGDYIVTIDSDDFLAVDFYRMLVLQAIRQDADIVCGKMVTADEVGGRQYVKIFNEPSEHILIGDEIFDAYMTYGYAKYFWVVVWNKLYRRAVWEKALPYLKSVDRHFLNCEDVYTTIVLHYFCQKYATVDYEGYYYSQNVFSVTSIHGDYKKYYKNISDVSFAFQLMKDFLVAIGKFERYSHFYDRWRDKEICLYNKKAQLSHLKSSDKKKLQQDLKELFHVEHIRTDKASDHFFYWFEEDLQKERYELDNKIIGNQYDGIVFNIKDILLIKPTLDDHDTLLFLDEKHQSLSNEIPSVLFSKIRRFAEEELYRMNAISDSHIYQVTLDQVYYFIETTFRMDADLLSAMKAYELDLEIKHTQARKSGKRLLELANITNKKIGLIWNTILPKETAKRILDDWGLSDMGEVFIASDYPHLKSGEEFYNFVLKTLGVSTDQWLYLASDHDELVRQSYQNTEVYHFPRPIDNLFNRLKDKNTGDGAALYQPLGHLWFDFTHATHSLMVRSALGLVANRYFDNPLRRFNAHSDFNSDPYFIGYFPVGMHVVGICQWLIEEAITHGYASVTFDSEEGNLFKQVYDILSEAYAVAPKARAMSYSLFYQQYCEWEDMIAWPSVMDMTQYSPKDILTQWLNLGIDERRVVDFEAKGFLYEVPFSGDAQFYDFIELIKENQLWQRDDMIHQVDVKENELVFCAHAYPLFESYLSRRHISIYKIYSLDQSSHHYYSIPPKIGDDIRHLFYSGEMSDINASKLIRPEALNLYVTESYLKNEIHTGTIDFVNDFVSQFFDYLPRMTAGRYDLSLPFEMLVNMPKEPDSRLFAFYSEKEKNIHQKWRASVQQYRLPMHQNNGYDESIDYGFLYGRSKYHKALFYLIYKRGDFKAKFKHKFAHKPLTLAVLARIYRLMRFVKNRFAWNENVK